MSTQRLWKGEVAAARLWATAWLLLIGCGDLGADYDYDGAQKLASGSYSVAAVFQSATVPVVMAVRRDDEDTSATDMHLLRLSDGEECRAGAFDGYLAAGDSRGFRLALSQAEGRWSFFDESCQEALTLQDVGGLRVLVDPWQYQHVYLMVGDEDTLLNVDPFVGTSRLLATGLTLDNGSPLVQASTLPVLQAGEFALWVRRNGGGLELLAARTGERVAGPIQGVSGLVTLGGLSVEGVSLELLAMSQAEGGVVFALAGAMGGSALVVPVLEEAAACQPRIHPSLVGCADSRCADASGGGFTLAEGLEASGLPAVIRERLPDSEDVQSWVELLPWVGMERPCGSGRWVLKSLATGEELLLGEIEGSYTEVDAVDSSSTPALLYVRATADAGAKESVYLQLGAAEQTLPVPVDTGSVIEWLPTLAGYRVTTSEVAPRVGLLRPGTGFQPLVEDVAVVDGRTVVSGSLVLYDAQDGTGTLALCRSASCTDLSTGVAAFRYRHYLTQPRVGDSTEAVAFLRNLGDDDTGGELVVAAPDLGEMSVLDRGVTSFRDVERGPARGIVYSVAEATRRGLWFAPR